MKRFFPGRADAIDAGLILAAGILPFLIAVLTGLAPGPWDQIRHMPPWNGPASGHPWTILSMDSVLQFYGWRMQVFHAWSHFQIPWWNPYILNGTPLLANSQSGALYLPHVIVGILRLPVALAICLLDAAHLCFAGLGVWLLVKRLGGSRAGALTAGLSVTASAFMISWAPLSSVIETAAWIPWCLVFAQELTEARAFAWRPAAFLGLCTAMMLYAGHLQFAAYGIIAVILWLAFSVSRDGADKWPRASVLAAGACGLILGAILAWPQLGPVLAMGKQSHRQTSPSMANYSGYAAGADQWYELPSLASSALLGLPTANAGSDQLPLPGYWPAYVSRGAAFPETAFAWGPVVFLAVIWGFRKKQLRRSRGAIAVGAAGLLLAFGTPLNMILYFGIPGWAATGSPGRSGILLLLGGCILAGLCLPSDDEAASAASLKVPAIALLATLALGMLALNWGASNLRIPQLAQMHLFGAISSQVLIGLVLTLVIAAIAAGGLLSRDFRVRIICLSAACILSPFLIYPVLQFGRPLDSAPKTSAQRIAAVNNDWQLLVPSQAIAPPNTLSLFGIHEASGYDSLIRKETQERLAAIDGEDPSPPANGNMMFIKPKFSPQLLAESGVTEVWSRSPIPDLPGAVQDDGFYRTPLPGPGRASTPSGPAKITAEGGSSITVQAEGPGPLTLRDDLQNDWKATVDGRPAEITWGQWPSIDLPSGSHTVVFYSTGAQKTGILALIALVLGLCILGAAAGPTTWRFSKRRKILETPVEVNG